MKFTELGVENLFYNLFLIVLYYGYENLSIKVFYQVPRNLMIVFQLFQYIEIYCFYRTMYIQSSDNYYIELIFK